MITYQDNIYVRYHINLKVLSLPLLLFWPSSLSPGELGKQISAVTLIILAFIICLKTNPKIKVNFPILIWLIYFIYCSFEIFLRPLILGIENFRDFAELIRVFGCFIFLILGYNWNASSENINKSIIIYCVITFLLAFSFVLNLNNYFPVNLYLTRGERFSGISTSVNYVFSSFSLLLILYLLNKNKNTVILLSLVITGSMAILLSGSRTSLLAIFGSIFILFLIYLKPKHKFLLLFFMGLLIYSITIIDFGFIEKFSNIKRVIDLLVIVIKEQNYLIWEIPTFAKRIDMWTAAWPIIKENIYFGYGAGKSIITILDNSFYMSLYRYGLVGLVIETFGYILTIIYCYRSDKKIGILVFVFLLVHLISGITASFLYELRVPYILFFGIGMFIKLANKKIKYDS